MRYQGRCLKFLILGLSLFVGFQHAFAEQALSSLNWQKADLESRLKEDLTKNLTATVGRENFVVNIDIAYKKPSKKTGNSETKERSEESSKISHDDQQLVFLNKLGLQAAIVNDSLESNKGVQANSEIADIFSLIEKVRLTCLLDESVSEDRQAVVKKIIANSLMQFDPKKIDIKIDKVKLAPEAKDQSSSEEEKQTQAPKEEEPTWIKKFEPFSTPISILLSFLTVMVMMLIMFRATKASVATAPSVAPSQASAATTPSSSEADSTKEHASEPASTMPSHSVGSARSSGDDSGSNKEVTLTFDKFKLFLKASPAKCRLILQEWISADTQLAQASIKSLALYLSLDEFNEITATFNPADKKKLKRILAVEDTNAPTMVDILSFLRAQMMAAYLTDDLELDPKQKSFMASLKPVELAALSTSDIGMVANVVNLLPPEAVAQLFNNIDTDKVERILHLSNQFKLEAFVSQFSAFESKINEIRESSKVVLSPILDGVESLLEQVGPEKESLLFTALISSKAYVLVEDLSKKYFPSELTLKFAPDQLKSIMLKLSLAKRAELIFALSEDERKPVFAALGETGKMRELIDSELESIQADEVRKKSIEINKVAIWKSFVDLVRANVKSNPSIQESAIGLVKNWVEEKKTTNSSSSQAA